MSLPCAYHEDSSWAHHVHHGQIIAGLTITSLYLGSLLGSLSIFYAMYIGMATLGIPQPAWFIMLTLATFRSTGLQWANQWSPEVHHNHYRLPSAYHVHCGQTILSSPWSLCVHHSHAKLTTANMATLSISA